MNNSMELEEEEHEKQDCTDMECGMEGHDNTKLEK